MTAVPLTFDPDLCAVYELGRLYYEAGFYDESERIFLGLLSMASDFTPAVVGLGVVRLERGDVQDALIHFREAIKQQRLVVEAKIGMATAFLALSEVRRAGTILLELTREVNEPNVAASVKQLWKALSIRCNT